MLVPVVNWVMPFILGAKGSAWAWRNRRWESIDHFKRVQRRWAVWGLGIYLAIGLIGVAGTLYVIDLLKHSDVYQQASRKLHSNEEAVSLLGEPISTGFPWGSFEVSGPTGKADFSFSANGSKAKGTVYVDAAKDFGAWKFNRIELEVSGRPGRINLN
jgi:hypothetical protein